MSTDVKALEIECLTACHMVICTGEQRATSWLQEQLWGMGQHGIEDCEDVAL